MSDILIAKLKQEIVRLKDGIEGWKAIATYTSDAAFERALQYIYELHKPEGDVCAHCFEITTIESEYLWPCKTRREPWRDQDAPDNA